MKVVLLLLVAVMLIPGHLMGEPKDDVKEKTGETASLKFDFIDKSLIVVPVLVNDTGPYRFLLDTGAGITVLSARLGRRLNLQNGRTESMGTAGGSVLVRLHKIVELQVGHIEIANPVVAVADFDLIKSLKIDGILGAEILKAFSVLIDYPKQILQIERA